MTKTDEKIRKLLEYELKPTPQGGWKITEEMRALIHEIAEQCNNIEITKKVNEDIPEWIEKAAPEEIYIHMLQKIASAPTRMHMICVPRILIPIIDQKLYENDVFFQHTIIVQELEGKNFDPHFEIISEGVVFVLFRKYSGAEMMYTEIKKKLLKEVGFEYEKYIGTVLDNNTIDQMNAELKYRILEFQAKGGMRISTWICRQSLIEKIGRKNKWEGFI